jgi:hypothetical protein
LHAGVDIVTVQKILNHASVQTTARYDPVPKKPSAKRLSLSVSHTGTSGDGSNQASNDTLASERPEMIGMSQTTI